MHSTDKATDIGQFIIREVGFLGPTLGNMLIYYHKLKPKLNELVSSLYFVFQSVRFKQFFLERNLNEKSVLCFLCSSNNVAQA